MLPVWLNYLLIFSGRTTWEGFETATKAAAAGGVTTLVGE
jgi:hypothetical protein